MKVPERWIQLEWNRGVNSFVSSIRIFKCVLEDEAFLFEKNECQSFDVNIYKFEIVRIVDGAGSQLISYMSEGKT